MIRMSLRHLLTQRRQMVGIALAITLSVAFLIITQMAGSTLREGLYESVGRSYKHTDLALSLTTGDEQFTPADLDAIASLPGVAGVQPIDPFGAEYQRQGATTYLDLTVAPQPGPLQDDLVLDRGAWPTGANQLVLHDDAARAARVDVGDSIEVILPGTTTPAPLTVTGIWQGEGHFGAWSVEGFISRETWTPLAPNLWIGGIYVTLADGADEGAVLDAIEQLGVPAFSFQTRANLIDQEMVEAEAELAMLNTGITAFALLTIIVATLVVSNTFAILITQRMRDIALLRCAGATASQVRRLVLIEAGLVGVIAAAIGLGVAWLAGWGILALIQALWQPEILPGSPELPGFAPVVALAVGVLLAVAAAWAPSRTAMRIDPLVALRAAQEVESPLSHKTRTALAVLCGLIGGGILLTGAAISWNGNQGFGTLVGIVGGTISFGGVILGASVIVPVITRLFGRMTGRAGGVPAVIAATNAVRNPRRTTATAIALVIGVTLVTMMMVGAASLRVTLLDQVDSRAPIDYQVTFIDTRDSATRTAFIEDLAEVNGIGAFATIGEIEGFLGDRTIDTESTYILRVADPATIEAVWRDDDRLPFAPNMVLAPSWLFDTLALEDGDQTTLRTGGVTTTVTLVQEDRVSDPVIDAAMVPAMTSITPASIWLSFTPGADRDEVMNAAYNLADDHGVLLSSINASDYRETLESALDTMLLVVVGLLAVAIVISLIGVSNTLSLSVLERTRESALLRALGFTRRQLRQSLAIEGGLLAAVGASIGIVLGIAYGWIGTITLVGNAFTPAIAVPWGRLGLVVMVAIGCGLLASVLPARRAAEADPVVALADR